MVHGKKGCGSTVGAAVVHLRARLWFIGRRSCGSLVAVHWKTGCGSMVGEAVVHW